MTFNIHTEIQYAPMQSMLIMLKMCSQHIYFKIMLKLLFIAYHKYQPAMPWYMLKIAKPYVSYRGVICFKFTVLMDYANACLRHVFLVNMVNNRSYMIPGYNFSSVWKVSGESLMYLSKH